MRTLTMPLSSESTQVIATGVIEKVSRNKRLVAGAALVLASMVAIAIELGNTHDNVAMIRTRYYTVDEGQTLFTGPEDKLPPFDHKGLMAVQAHVYECDGKQFVAYLERYTVDAQRIISEVTEAAKTARPGDKPPAALALVGNAQRNGREVKKPGEGKWVAINSSGAGSITRVKCPGSGTPSEANPD